MFLKGAIRVAAKDLRNAISFGKAAAILSMAALLPLILYGFPTNPPIGLTGAPGEGTCVSCHSPTTVTGSGVTVTFPSTTGMTYTPGGGAQSWTVTVPSGPPEAFELSTRVVTDNSQAGTLTAGANSAVLTSNNIQYVFPSATASSWTIQWTPPATAVGNVNVYVTGVGAAFGTTFENSYTLTPAVTLPMLSVSPTSLPPFNVNNGTVTPTTQTIMVNSSGAAIPYTTGFSNTGSTACGNWLNVMPPGANTPVSVTVSIPTTVAASLPSGTCTGNVVITPQTGSASDGALMVSVTANVTVTTPPPPPPPPTLNLSLTSLTFTATAGGAAPSQNVSVTTSDGSSKTFSAQATVTTPTGGTWLSIGSNMGTIPANGSATETISVNTTGLAASTTPYTGNVTFSCSTCSPTSVMLPVTLTVNASTPPPPPPTITSFRFNLVVVDRQSVGNTDWMLLDGSGGMNSTGQFQGSGIFTRFHFPSGSTSGGTPPPLHRGGEGGSGGTGSGGTGSGGNSNMYVVATGRWSATKVMGFSPIYSPAGCTPGGTAPCRITGGTLNLQVTLSTQGCGGEANPSPPACATAPTTGSMTIISNGSNAGVALTTGAWTFVPAGIGTESMGNGDE